ncbi:arylesterase / paraoxonase [Entomortierella parvispora]|uniref:Arylesterase / paraoxonase n=1 Tax=Entomortierella parvispora TaxID=205924 RepID=A0A9P3HMK7_9FUNG|nr:arylesterase / paraoxonase [Entomortierella parvispora]
MDSSKENDQKLNEQQDHKSASTLRNRKTTVEDIEDDSDSSPVATTTATSISSSVVASTSKSKVAKDDSNEKPKLTRPARRNAPPPKKNRLKNFFVSLLVASTGVVIKSAYDKFVFKNRDISIDQTIGLQGNCYKSAFIPGPASIEISDHDRLAFVSSDDRSWQKDSYYFHRPSSKTAVNGGIYTLSLDTKNGTPKEVQLKGRSFDDFHPAGMSLYDYQDPQTKAWKSRLFVINHSHKGDAVELFDYSSGSNVLTHVKTVESSLFVTPKDIVAVDIDRFYLTNHHGTAIKYGRIVEDVAGVTFGGVVYHNGKDTVTALSRLANPNGIALSPDRSQIYVSSFIEKVVHVYNTTEDIVHGELVYDEDIWVGSNIDSLSVDKHTGDIYVASHPSYSTYLRHRLGYEPQSPSHVVKIEKLAPENYIPRKSDQPDYYFFPAPVLAPIKWEIKDLFYSNGEDISASTVATFWNNDLILGSPSSHHLLRCSLRLDQ